MRIRDPLSAAEADGRAAAVGTWLVPVLLGGGSKVIVESKAAAFESWYKNAQGAWVDLTKDDPSVAAYHSYYMGAAQELEWFARQI